MKKETAAAIASATDEAEKLKHEGWTKQDFADALERELASDPVMDEDDAHADLKNLCTELKARNAALAAALRDCLAPLQDAQNQLHHVRAATAYINAKTILRES